MVSSDFLVPAHRFDVRDAITHVQYTFTLTFQLGHYLVSSPVLDRYDDRHFIRCWIGNQIA